MFKNLKSTIIFLLFFISFYSNLYSNERLINDLKEGEKIIFIRHALAPGSGDPANFDLSNCSTQRNLNIEGVKQSKKIGKFFLKNNIPIDQVLTSEWCRCKDTSKYAFKNYETFSPLNSFFSKKFEKNKESQMINLLNFLKKWNSKKNLVLVTHYVVILEITDQSVSSGEIVILDKNLNLLGTIIL
tara:strand:+ start:60 stop:617 length:558 start_codon:yes stop_codon:yes gene_type:complete